jgi:hypothetical protein
MPQLKTGRHVALSASPYLDALASEKGESKYFAAVALRLHANTPRALCDHLVVGYFVEGQGTPPHAPSYNSGYCVADVLAGRSDWSVAEVEEFRQFLDEPRVGIWLQTQFDELNDAIRDNPVWDSELLVNDVESDEFDVPMLKRAIIQKSAAEPKAMAQLRGARMLPETELPSGPNGSPSVREDQFSSRPELPDELRDFILTMAQRADVHSVSCQFLDARLWEGLLGEQVERARVTGKPPRQAFFLCGPDGGIPGIAKHYPGLEDLPQAEWFKGSTLEETMGGDIHIPYEGVCGADLYVYPNWRKIYPDAWDKEGAELDWATARKPCNHLLIEQELPEPTCAIRIGPIAGSWWLYSSKAPYKACSPFHQDDWRRLL